jgi:hypothetical protein
VEGASFSCGNGLQLSERRRWPWCVPKDLEGIRQGGYTMSGFQPKTVIIKEQTEMGKED